MENEEWKNVKNFPDYSISNSGKIKNIETGEIIKGHLKNSNHLVRIIDIDGKRRDKIMKYLVAETFIENPNNYKYVEHIDSNKLNNNYSNLKWIKQKNKNKGKFFGDEDEEWKIISENNNYEVSNKGNVRNNHTKELIKSRKNRGGYILVSLKGKKRNNLVHTLVAKAFMPNPEMKPTVDHIDRNRSNNNMENLRWATMKEQCNNRNCKGKVINTIIQNRKIWQINPNDENDKKLHNNIEDVINFIIENGLSRTSKRKSIHTNLRTQLNNSENKSKIYGYNWAYELVENLENEEWKQVKEKYPKAHDYSISNMGRIKNEIGHIVPGTIDAAGYKIMYLGIGNKRYKVHRLVAQLFIPNPKNKRCVNHKDGNKINNCFNNLEWSTHSENTQHAMDNNLNPCSKQIKAINIDTKEETIYVNQKDASNKLKIGAHTVSKYIKNGKPFNGMLFIKI